MIYVVFAIGAIAYLAFYIYWFEERPQRLRDREFCRGYPEHCEVGKPKNTTQTVITHWPRKVRRGI